MPNATNHETAQSAAPRNGLGTLGDRVRSLRLPGAMGAGGGGGGGRSWLPWVLVVLLAGLSLYLGSLVSNLSPPPEAAKSPASRPAVKTRGDGKGAPGAVVFEAKGYVIPVQQIQVSPKVGGMVERLYVEEGKRVKKGEILCELEKVDYQADYDRAVATLKAARHRLEETEKSWPEETEQARAEVESSEAEYKQLLLEFRRNTNLRGTGSTAARDLEQAEAAARSMERKVDRLRLAYKVMLGPRKERIDSARAEVKQAQADLDKARWRLDNCVIYAPTDGTILTKKTEQWNIVNPVAFNISASICEMADLTQLEVDLTIQERDISKIFKGQKCRVRPDVAQDRSFPGEVWRLMPIADRSKGTVSVRVRVDPRSIAREDEGKYLRPEGAALVSFLRAETEPARTSPGAGDRPAPGKKQ
jgi:multidrug resistance efflux pump